MLFKSSLFLSLGLLLCMSTRAADNKPIDQNKTLQQIKVDRIKKKIDAMFPDYFDKNHECSDVCLGAPLFHFHFDQADESHGQFMDSATLIHSEESPIRDQSDYPSHPEQFSLLKKAVFAKNNDLNFEKDFNTKHPKLTNNALLELAKYVDSWQFVDTYVSQIKIGKESVIITSPTNILVYNYLKETGKLPSGWS